MNEITIMLGIALVVCGYVLVLLVSLQRKYPSWSWRFIFGGISLLCLECAIGVHLAWKTTSDLGWEEDLFAAIIVAKALCYAAGFSIWLYDRARVMERLRKAIDKENKDERARESATEQIPG